MLAKLRLDKTKKYEQALATYEISSMVVDFVLGRKHYLCVGSEQGGISKWDDIVIEIESNSQIHIQVKRQTSGEFGSDSDECIRNEYKNKPRIGQKRDLSPLDETMKSLADWFEDIDITTMTPKREFWIVLPELNTKIKKDLEVKDLHNLCESIKPAVTTAAGLQALADADKMIRNCFDWLTTWCDFKDWNHILKVIQFLKIKNPGMDTQIEAKTDEKLKEIFITDKVMEVRSRITAYTSENASFSGAISPRNLLFELKDFIRSDINFWTQYYNNGSQWNVCGTQDLEFNTKIERSSVVIPKLWNSTHISHLKVNAAYKQNCKLSESLMRIAVHQSGSKMSFFTDKNDWENHLKIKIGNTLGVSDSDTLGLNIVENNERFLSTETRSLVSLSDQEADAEELNKNMLSITWEAIKNKIDDKIRTLNTSHSSELRDAIDERWRNWVQLLNASTDEQRNLLRGMLHPNAEGKNINSDLRVGPKTVDILAGGLLLLLVASACIDNQNTGNWKTIAGIYNTNTIALQYWSGLPGKVTNVKEIIEDCKEVIGQEHADLLIFSKIQASHSEVLELKIDEPVQKENTLAEGKQLKMLMTHNIQLRQLIEKGEIKGISDYLNKMLIKKEEI